jgi:adenylate cyclase
VFVDLSAFTDYTAEQGDDAAGRVLAAFRAATRRVTSDHGVRVAKWLGDGAMIVAVDQGDAVTTALDLEREAVEACAPVALRVGIATGLALLFEGDDYIGSAVNLAARLCDVAEPYEVLAHAASMGQLPPGAVAHPAGTRVLRGFHEPVPVVRIECGVDAAFDDGEVWTRDLFVA